MPAESLCPIDDEATAVEGYQLRPHDVPGFTTWAGVPAYRSGSAGVLLVDGGRPVGPVELGDYAVRVDGRLRHEPFDGFWNRYTPVFVGDSAVVSADA